MKQVNHFTQLKAISFVGGASALNILMATGLSLALAKILPVEQFGITRSISAYLVILTMLGHCCIHDAAASFIASATSKSENDMFVSSSFYLVLLTSFFVLFMSELWIGNNTSWDQTTQKSFATIITLLPFYCLVILFTAITNAQEHYKKMSLIILLNGFLSLSIIGLLTQIGSFPGWILGRMVAGVSVFSLSFFITMKFSHLTINIRKLAIHSKLLFSYAKIQIISGILSMCLASADIILLERYNHNFTEVGIYGLAALFAKSATIVPDTISRTYLKQIAAEYSTANSLKTAYTLLAIIAITCIILAGCVSIIGSYIIKIFYNHKFQHSIQILDILCFGIVFSGIWAALSVVNIATRKPKSATIISSIGLATCLLGFPLFIPHYGAIGAAWVMNASYFTGSMTGIYLLTQYTKG